MLLTGLLEPAWMGGEGEGRGRGGGGGGLRYYIALPIATELTSCFYTLITTLTSATLISNN